MNRRIYMNELRYDPRILINSGQAAAPGRLYPIEPIDTYTALDLINKCGRRYEGTPKWVMEDFDNDYGESVGVFMIKMIDHLIGSLTIDEQAYLCRIMAIFIGRAR